jgi:hypothetical protein
MLEARVPMIFVRGESLRLFGISKSGLIAMTLAVSALWGCIVLERTSLRQAEIDARERVKMLNRLREQAVPASDPVQPFRSRAPQKS